MTTLLKVNGRIYWDGHEDKQEIMEATGLVQLKEDSPFWGNAFPLEKQAASAAIIQPISVSPNPFTLTDFDAGIKVENQSLNLVGPGLTRMKTTFNSTGDIYFQRMEFEKDGIFYKVVKNDSESQRETRNTSVVIESNVIFALNRVDVKGVPTIISRGITTDGRIYIKMRGLPNSQPLSDFKIFREYPLEKKIAFMRRIAQIIAVIHDKNIVHNDIKIENIIVSPQTEELMVIDFGNSQPKVSAGIYLDFIGFGRTLEKISMTPAELRTTVHSDFNMLILQIYQYTYKDMYLVVSKLKAIEGQLIAANSTTVKASSALTTAPGGIDFNAENLNIETKMNSRFRGSDSVGRGNDNGIQFQIDPQQFLELQNAPGFTPVIINIQPLINLQLFLGLKEGEALAVAGSERIN